jgi:Ca-activated chloride channel family protein
MIGYHYPQNAWWLVALAAMVGLYAWSRWKRLRDLNRIADARLLPQLVVVQALARRRLKDKLALVGFFLVIAAACGPQFGSNMKEVRQRGVDIFIAMDTSRSMLAEDVVPSRIEHAKRALGLLIQKVQGNRVGIIAFAKRALIQCPLTVDSEAARMFLDVMDTNTVPEQGTSIGDAIRLALERFPKDDKGGKAIILLTDGEDHNSDPLEAAKAAKKAGVVIFTIGIGTTKGEVIKNRDENGNVTGFMKHNGEMVMSHMDDALLTEIATLTDGKYYRASSTDREIDEIADTINALSKNEFATKMFQRLQERYQYPLLLALLLLLFEFFFAENPGQASRLVSGLKLRALFSFAFVLLAFAIPGRADFKDHVRQAAAYVKKGDFEKARAEYESAQNDEPESPIIPYNIAATYYAQGKMDDAFKQFARAWGLTNDPGLKAKIAYNWGHALFSNGDSAGAIEKFKECLRLTPGDRDAKYNIEYIKAGKKPPQKPQQPKPQSGNGKNDKQNQGKGDQQDKNQQPKPGQMSKESAEQILQMMKDQESENMKKSAPKMSAEKQKQDKKKEDSDEDW